jgi:hypothetical protein
MERAARLRRRIAQLLGQRRVEFVKNEMGAWDFIR